MLIRSRLTLPSVVTRIYRSLGGLWFPDYSFVVPRGHIRIEVDDRLAAQEPFLTMGRKITQADFPAIIQAIRAQNREEFGPDADQPD